MPGSPTLARRVLPALLTFAGLYALLCVVAYVFQERLVYFPSGRPSVTPDAVGLDWADVRLETADGVELAAWHVRAAGDAPARCVVIVSHGNGGHLGLWLGTARAFARLGCDVLLYDYRGYGDSAGRPSEEGTYSDAEAAWAYVAEHFPPERIVAYGQSLGGAVTVELARRRRVSGVIVESTFSSIVDVGAAAYPWLPVRWLSRIRYDSMAKVPGIETPLLILHSSDDEMIPLAHARRLQAAAGGPAELFVTRGGHNDGGFLLEPAALAAVERFLDEVLQ